MIDCVWCDEPIYDDGTEAAIAVGMGQSMHHDCHREYVEEMDKNIISDLLRQYGFKKIHDWIDEASMELLTDPKTQNERKDR